MRRTRPRSTRATHTTRCTGARGRRRSSWRRTVPVATERDDVHNGNVRFMTVRPQTTVLEALDRRLADDPDGPYLDFEGDEYSARRMDAESNRLARALAELGIQKGDRVATLLENGPPQVVSFFAALKLGAGPGPVSPASHADCIP